MAYRELNSLRLKEEYCNKPKGKDCPIHKTCYDDEFQCRYCVFQHIDCYRKNDYNCKDGIEE